MSEVKKAFDIVNQVTDKPTNITYRDGTILIDKRPKKGGWASGDYLGRCNQCRKEFIGDKRATTCADCAYCEHDFSVYSPLIMDYECSKCGLGKPKEDDNYKNCKHDYRCMYRHPTSDMKCTKCGKVITHDQYLEMKQSDPSTVEQSLLSTGWICPVCGRGNSPMKMTCDCKSLFSGKQVGFGTQFVDHI